MSRLAPKSNELRQLHQKDLPKMARVKVFDKSINEIKAFGPVAPAPAPAVSAAPAPAK